MPRIIFHDSYQPDCSEFPNSVADLGQINSLFKISLWLSNFQAAVFLNLEDLEMDYGEVRVSLAYCV